MASIDQTRLLADVGGTNIRFAWQAATGAALMDIESYKCADHASLQAAIEHYLIAHAGVKPVVCAIGIANPVLGDHVQMTNHHWAFSIAKLQAALDLERLRVINDFTAMALALPHLQPDDLHPVGGGAVVPGEAMALLGPGTGLGVSGLLPGADQRWTPIRGEGGHVSLAAASALEFEVVLWLSRRFGHASAERALSGPGLVNLHEALSEIHGQKNGQKPASLQPAFIVRQAMAEPAGICAGSVEMFCAFLGSVAGDLALTLGARGGLFLGGGMLPKMLGSLDRSAFRQRFIAKGRFSAYLDAVPTAVINTKVPAGLIGAAAALDS